MRENGHSFLGFDRLLEKIAPATIMAPRFRVAEEFLYSPISTYLNGDAR